MRRGWRVRGTAPAISPAQFRAALLEMRRQIETHCDYVGNRFAEEARRIHYGEIDPHGIYGEASEEDRANWSMKASRSAASRGFRPPTAKAGRPSAASP